MRIFSQLCAAALLLAMPHATADETALARETLRDPYDHLLSRVQVARQEQADIVEDAKKNHHGRFVYFRLSARLQPFFDRSFQLPNFEIGE